MVKKSAEIALVGLAGIVSAAPALAQNPVSQIDPEHSTARLYLASSKNPTTSINVGVARASGVVKLRAGIAATPEFDFTIYPADKKLAPANSEEGRADNSSRYTVISFKSRRTVSLGENTYRVSGDLTVTDVQRVASCDPSEAFAGATYGPSITISQTQPASFEFRRATPTGSTASGEWIASSTTSAEDFPELLTAVSATVWPVFVADEQCTTPSNVGKDFSGEVCTEIAPAITTPDEGHHKNADPGRLVANEVQIQLDLLTTSSSSTASLTSGK